MRVVIADDSVLLREGLVRLLTEAGFEVVAAVGDGPGLIAAIEEHRPDIWVVDVRMPPALRDEGLVAANRGAAAGARHAGAGALAVRRGDVRGRVTRGGEPGIGYLLKDRVADVGEFVEAVRRVAAGGTVLDPEVVAQLLTRRRRDDRVGALTPREQEVLSLMAEGRSNSAIADAMGVGEGAVEKHVTSILGKLGIEPAHSDHRRVLAVLAYLRG